jgi:hypothetical protein
MTRTLNVFAAALSLSFMIVSCAGAQESLGDVARQQRESKKASSAKVYTNDDIAASVPAAQPATTDKAEKSEKADAAAAPASKTEDKGKLAADLKAKVDEQKKAVSQLERELDVAQREYRLKVAVYYNDVGNNLRDSKKWAEEDRKQRAELESKQKALNEARQKLADMQEHARKAGMRTE